jgi:hypothetical protein
MTSISAGSGGRTTLDHLPGIPLKWPSGRSDLSLGQRLPSCVDGRSDVCSAGAAGGQPRSRLSPEQEVTG